MRYLLQAFIIVSIWPMIVPALIGAIGGIAGTVLGGLFGSKSQQNANATNIQLQQMANQSNQQIALETNVANRGMVEITNQANLQQARENREYQKAWELEKAQNAHQWQTADMRAAGLNPILSANMQGAQAGSITQQAPEMKSSRDTYAEQKAARVQADLTTAQMYAGTASQVVGIMKSLQDMKNEKAITDSMVDLNSAHSVLYKQQTADIREKLNTNWYGTHQKMHLASANQMEEYANYLQKSGLQIDQNIKESISRQKEIESRIEENNARIREIEQQISESRTRQGETLSRTRLNQLEAQRANLVEANMKATNNLTVQKRRTEEQLTAIAATQSEFSEWGLKEMRRKGTFDQAPFGRALEGMGHVMEQINPLRGLFGK